MSLFNTPTKFGLISLFLHWLMAFLLYGLFFLGYWMVDLGYYHDWYEKAPFLHISFGFIILILLFFRLAWRFFNPPPVPLKNYLLATTMYYLLYFCIFLLCLSGYLLASVTGELMTFFNLFEIMPFEFENPLWLADNQEEIMTIIHQYGAYLLIILSLLHATAAFIHAFIYKDKTLTRIFGL